MRYAKIPNKLFEKNRGKVLKLLPTNSSAVVFSNPQMPRNGDEFHTYRQNSDFFYLTGICQEKSVLILSNTGEQHEYLFLLEAKPELEQWEGKKLQNDEAEAISGIKNIFTLSQFNEIWNELAQKSDYLFYGLNNNPRLKTDLLLPDKLFGQELAEKWKNKDVRSLDAIMTECRIVKEPEEIALIKKASDITREAFFDILPHAVGGLYEYELESIMTSCFIRNGAEGHAFSPIISNGENTCYLHYIKNDQKLINGNLLLMDFGSEYANYASDCTRVLPIGGKFSTKQKKYYNAVYSVFKEIRNFYAPGKTIEETQKETCKLIQDELLSLKLISKSDIYNRGEKPAYYKYYMHNISHFIGLDTHDVGEKDVVLRPGMVISCEPGIYDLENKIGIRLEDTLVITENGNLDLMESIPMNPEEIEYLMNTTSLYTPHQISK